MLAPPRPFPWDEAIGFALGVLRLSSDAFWRMTPRELSAVLRRHAAQQGRVSAPDHASLAALMMIYPD